MNTIKTVIDTIYSTKHTIFVHVVNALGLTYDPTNGDVYK